MNKCKYIILTIILILFIINIDIVINSTKEASILFFNKVFISIFPFIILSEILIYYDYHIFLNKIFGNFLSKLFNIDKNSTIVFILSMLTSSPSNSIFIKDMLDNNLIDIKTANKIICYTYFPSISFVMGISLSIFKNLKIGLILWLNVLLNNIIIGLYLRKEKIIINNNIKPLKKDNLITILKESIIKGINTSTIILGNLIIFTILINIVDKYINCNITLLLELTSSIIKISNMNITNEIKLLLIQFMLCFSSISIILQSITILNKYKFNIKKILIIKLVFSLLICSLSTCIYFFIIKYYR